MVLELISVGKIL